MRDLGWSCFPFFPQVTVLFLIFNFPFASEIKPETTFISFLFQDQVYSQ